MPDEKIFLNYRPGDTSFILKVPFDKKERAKRIGGVWDQTAKGWRFPVDTGLWEQIRRNFGGKGDLLVDRAFLDKIAAVEENQRRFEGMRRLAEEDSPIDFAVPGVALDGKNPLFNYQKWGVKCAAMAEDGFLIGDQPGLGKTAQALAIAILRRNRGEISNCLIICPASLKYNWLDEIAKFTRERALVIDGTAKERRQKWMAAGYFFKITNYETFVNDLFVPADPRLKARKAPLPADEVAFRKYMQGQYAMVCCDEIHALKHFDSQRTQAVKQLRARYRLGLSGIPAGGERHGPGGADRYPHRRLARNGPAGGLPQALRPDAGPGDAGGRQHGRGVGLRDEHYSSAGEGHCQRRLEKQRVRALW